MATLQIKNKYEVSFRKLIRESGTDGGIPDVIQVSGKEAWDILNEIRECGQRGFVVKVTGKYDPNFMLKSTKEKLDKETAQDLVNRWWKKEYEILFKHIKDKIPVVVINTKPPAPPKELPAEVDKPDDSGNNGDSDN